MKNRIREVRLQKKMTLEQLAARCDRGTRTIQRYETGERKVSLQELERIAKALSVSPEKLLGLPETEGGWTGEIPDANLWKIIETVIELGRDHPKTDVKDLIAIAKALRQQDAAKKPLNIRNLRKEGERLIAYEMARH